MNPTPDPETETIRSEIDSTRHRMDETMDAIGERLHGRHLLDEILGLFRRNESRTSEWREKIASSAETAAHSVVDTVKSHPVPALLVGAGVGWMIYESRRKSRAEDESFEPPYGDGFRSVPNDPDEEAFYDRPLDYPSSAVQGSALATGAGSSQGAASYSPTGASGASAPSAGESSRISGKASNVARQARQKLSHLGEQVREKSHVVGEQARELGSRVQDRARETYQRSRERVTRTADDHPLELGLACLAAGFIAGLALPTPERVNRLAGSAADRLRDRTREKGTELLHKGQRVAHAAVDAAKKEASTAVDEIKQAATDTAREEGLVSGKE